MTPKSSCDVEIFFVSYHSGTELRVRPKFSTNLQIDSLARNMMSFQFIVAMHKKSKSIWCAAHKKLQSLDGEVHGMGLLDDVLGSGVPKGNLAKPLLIALGALLESGALHKDAAASSEGV